MINRLFGFDRMSDSGQVFYWIAGLGFAASLGWQISSYLPMKNTGDSIFSGVLLIAMVIYITWGEIRLLKKLKHKFVLPLKPPWGITGLAFFFTIGGGILYKELIKALA